MIDFNPIQAKDTVFIGDSLTESFDLSKHFHRSDLRNRGVSGSLTDHVIYRMEEVSNAHPKKVFILIGINDLFAGQPVTVIIENIERIVNHFLDNCPGTMLYVQSILPVNVSKLFEDEGINLNIYEINNRIEGTFKSQENVQFINLHHEFLDMKGQLNDSYSYDGVHLNETGYTLWARLIKPYV